MKITKYLFLFLLLSFGCSTNNPIEKKPTEDTGQKTAGLTISATTTNTGGNFTPYNVVAIWVENSNGEFVKSLTVYAIIRKFELSKWISSSGGNTVDAKTGATKSSFGKITGNWNGKDMNGETVPDGKYNLWLEISDKGGKGNASSFSFIKGKEIISLTPANITGFTDIKIYWKPI